jgi:hypothetical protein
MFECACNQLRAKIAAIPPMTMARKRMMTLFVLIVFDPFLEPYRSY